MMEIDWSKAPKGTTHFHPRVDGYVEHWVKRKDGKSWFCVTDFEKEGWRSDSTVPSDKNLICIPERDIKAREHAVREKAIAEIISDLSAPRDIAVRAYILGYRKRNFEIVEDDACRD